MKIGLATTTIHVPTALKLMRACSPDYAVQFFIAADEKTPYCIEFQNWLTPEYQRSLGYKCSNLLGWNTSGRRNIAILEALKWGAEVVVLWDDDNLAMSTDYFDRFEMVLGSTFSGIAMGGNEWFDVGALLQPKAAHRGFPINRAGWGEASPVVDAKIGVAAGICLGDPDISAVDRIANYPIVHSVSELLRAGIVVHPTTWTVFNSQNTAFLRELAPCFLMAPQFERDHDIYASLVAQRVMRETGHVVHFGQPFVWQQRNAHDLLKDLRAELWDMEHILQFTGWLNDLEFTKGWRPIDMVRELWHDFERVAYAPPGVSKLGLAWCDDVEKVL